MVVGTEVILVYSFGPISVARESIVDNVSERADAASSRPALRPEIEVVVREALRDRRWDDAIFDALRTVEAKLQLQCASALIGSGLVSLAFDPPNARVRISPNPADAQRLSELFRGALGFLKGDRSHKDAPAVPCPDEETCLRALSLASYLLDLLDLDENAAPFIQAVHGEGTEALELETLRTSPSTVVLVDGAEAPIVSRDGDVLRVRLPSALKPLSIRLRDGHRSSPPMQFAPQAPAQDDNFHLVERVDLTVYDAPAGGGRRAHAAVRLRSYEGGRSYLRVFPAARQFQVGEYVTWDWEMTEVSPESWVEGLSGGREYAWTTSAFFAGRHLAKRSAPSLVEIQLRPREIRLRPGERAPVRVIAFYRDGPACWREDVTGRAELESLNPDVLLVTREPGLHAKNGGTTQLRARFEKHFSSAPATVAALPQGTVAEWLGGYRRMVGLLAHPDGMLVAHQSDHLLAVRPSMKVDRLAQMEVPSTAPSAIDVFAASPIGDLYIRSTWSRDLFEVPRDGGFSRSARIATAEDRTAFMSLTWSPPLDGLLIGDSAGRIWLWRKGGRAEVWATLPLSPIGLVSTDDALLLVPGGGRVSGYGRLDWSARTLLVVDPPTRIFGSALLPRTDDVLLASFNEGRVYSIRKTDATTELFAEGFTNPSALAQGEDGSVFVANFGGDSISRVLP